MIATGKSALRRGKRGMGRIRQLGAHIWEHAIVSAENAVSLPQRPTELVILDDVFPHFLSAFRIAEYNRYLAAYPDALVYSTARSFPALGETRSLQTVVAEYEQNYPQFRGRVRKFHPGRNLHSRLVYTVFLQNLDFFLSRIDREAIPFIFTLYPGGGFLLDQPDGDRKLRQVFNSPNFRKVIVTQTVTQQYLCDHHFCAPEQIAFIYGGVFPSDSLAREPIARARYGQDKPTFDLCFVAHKYMPRGVDKGYDIFVAVAQQLACAHDIRFHVVGPFDQSDIDVQALGSRITFYGTQPTSFFPGFYACMDAILSPNVPFVLRPGAFDGFPTGSCIEAGLCGTAVFCTDPLGLNVAFQDGKEIVIVPPAADAIAPLLDTFYQDPGRLAAVGRQGQAAFRRVFDIDAQMAPRLRIIAESLERAR